MYLQLTVYEPSSPLHQSDQIAVPEMVWMMFAEGGGEGPHFVEVGEAGSGVWGRVHPADIPADCCAVPRWMWERLGAPHGEECWVGLTRSGVLPAASLTLRPHRHATLQDAADPLALLTAELTGSTGRPSWAVLTTGMTLQLACGDFDVMGVAGEDGAEIGVGCILDRDVRLELMEALDYVAPRPPTPIPAEPVALPTATRWQDPTLPRGFIPFSGAGRRLDS